LTPRATARAAIAAVSAPVFRQSVSNAVSWCRAVKPSASSPRDRMAA
jgi:hypothetical protein